MGITPEQRERRRERVGASDVAPILGLDPFRDGHVVWLEKTGRWDGLDETNEAIELGNDHEEGLIRFAERKLGVPITRDVEVRPDDSFMSCNLDGFFERDGARFGVEAKTSSYVGDWGVGDDEVPRRVTVQVQAQCHIAHLDGVYVVVLLPEYGRLTQRLYFVERDDELIEAMLPSLRTFWFQHVQDDTPPAATERALEVVKRIHRREGKHALLPVEKYEQWLVANSQANYAAKVAKKLKTELLAELGDAEIGDLDGKRELTYFAQDRTTYGLGDKYVEQVCDKCGVGRRTTTSRTMRERKVRQIGGPRG